MSSPKRFVRSRYLLISIAVLALDQWSKWLVELHLPLYFREPVIPGLLNLAHVRNTGVAFGMFANHGSSAIGTWVLSLLGLGALTFVLVYFSRVPEDSRLLLVALTLVLGGAVGNLLDRITTGGVTDFIDFYFRDYHWHTFNVADSAITIGIGLMLISSFSQQRSAAAEVEPVTLESP